MNRSQRRRQQSRQRGVGFTRQFSSRRARLQHGTDQKLSRKYVELLKAIREALKAQTQTSEPESPENEPTEISQSLELAVGTTEAVSVSVLNTSSAKDLVAGIKAGNFDPMLADLLEAEANGKSRISVTKALNERLASLYNTTGVVPPDGVILGQTTAAELAAR